MLTTFITYIINILQNKTGKFLTIISRPILASAMKGAFSEPVRKLPSTAIVMQGPVVQKQDFTLETMKLYKKIFPKALLILSTWNSEDQTYLEQFKKLGVTVLQNAYPPQPLGSYTINLQIVSTLAGIREAKRRNAQYILKTRTDQRMYGRNLLEFFINLLTTFPVVKGYKQKKRLVVHSMYTFKYRLYSVTDMNIFGTTEDMFTYYSVPLDERDINNKKHYSTLRNIFEIATCRVGEMYLLTEYLARIGRKLNWTLTDSWAVYRDHFIVVDQSVFDIFWLKYDVYHEYRHRNYAQVNNKDELTFVDWFNLYSNFANQIIPERTQKYGFDEPVKPAYFKM